MSVEQSLDDDIAHNNNDREGSSIHSDYNAQEILVDQDGNVIEQIIEEVDGEADMIDDGGEIEYVEEMGHMGESDIIMDGEIVLEEDAATQSLVALSRGQDKDQMSGRLGPRILRRQHHGQQRFYDLSSQGQSTSRPNYPVPQVTKPLLPVAVHRRGVIDNDQIHVDDLMQGDKQKDWRQQQREMLEVYEIMDSLPEHLKEPFRRMAEKQGREVQNNSRFGKKGTYRTTTYRQLTSDGRYSAGRDLVDNDIKPVKSVDPSELADMPQLEEVPVDQRAELQQGEAQIDVEGYDSNDEHDVRYDHGDDKVFAGNEEYYEEDHGADLGRRQHEPYFLQDHLQMSGQPQYVEHNEAPYPQDMRFCPGCKIQVKRSVFYHHSRMIKKYGICNMFTPKRFPCGYQGCDEKLGTVEKLCEHMAQIHGAPTEIKTEVFSGEPEFQNFLRELEDKGGNFRMSRGNKILRAGLVQYFRCNRTQALAKEKTLRNCDEVSIYGEMVGDGVDRRSDPFALPNCNVGGKPCLRTEESCTAFYRKAYLQNGMIEVRYCDHHLHDDERIRLPFNVRDRVHEMNRKGLSATVIMLVLQYEREKYCNPGTAIERRILSLTPRDITNILNLKPSKRRMVNVPPIANGARRDDREEDENIVKPLTEVEKHVLELYDKNQTLILSDIQKIKRTDGRKRQCREVIRNHVYDLGRFIRTSLFSEMGVEQLEVVASLLTRVADTTKMKSELDIFPLTVVNPDPTLELNPEDKPVQFDEINPDGSIVYKEMSPLAHPMRAPKRQRNSSGETSGRKRKRPQAPSGGVIVEPIHGSHPRIEEHSMPPPDPVSDIPAESVIIDVDSLDAHPSHALEEHPLATLEEAIELHQQQLREIPKVETPPPSKRGRKPKGRKTETDQEPMCQPSQDSESIIQLPERTRTGRVVRRKTVVDY